MNNAKRPHFSLRELFLSVLLISIGCAGLSTFGWSDTTLCSNPVLAARVALLASAPAWIGAGIGTLFHEPIKGALYGLIALIGLFLVATLAFYPAVRS